MPAQRGRGGGCRCNAMARLAKAVCAARGAVFLNSCRFLLDVILQGNPGALQFTFIRSSDRSLPK